MKGLRIWFFLIILFSLSFSLAEPNSKYFIPVNTGDSQFIVPDQYRFLDNFFWGTPPFSNDSTGAQGGGDTGSPGGGGGGSLDTPLPVNDSIIINGKNFTTIGLNSLEIFIDEICSNYDNRIIVIPKDNNSQFTIVDDLKIFVNSVELIIPESINTFTERYSFDIPPQEGITNIEVRAIQRTKEIKTSKSLQPIECNQIIKISDKLRDFILDNILMSLVILIVIITFIVILIVYRKNNK